MNAASPAPWEFLFPAPISGERMVRLRCRLVRKHGHPLLLVPVRRRTIGASLGMYPAQTRRAKALRGLFGLLLWAGCPLGTTSQTLCVNPEAGLTRFLFPESLVQETDGLALLCGNPHAPGRRFILLVFDRAGRPRFVVKTGRGEAARRLIRAETAFLKSAPAAALNAPQVLGTFSEGGIEAVRLEYVPGTPPQPHDTGALPDLLESWLHLGQQVHLADLPAWQRLASASGNPELCRRLESAMGSTLVCPAIYHGDFAPWNVRVDPATRRWAVLDWERGEAMGPPGWDWFHYVVQTEILVARRGPEATAACVEALLRSDTFQRYAVKAGMEKSARFMMLACLACDVGAISPVEDSRPVHELMNLLAQRWLPD